MHKLIIICGISFAGKTTLGNTIVQRFDYAEVDVDDMKFHLFGPDIKDTDLSQADWVRIYAETDVLIERYLKAGQTVVDASRNFKKHERQEAGQIAANVGVEIVTVFVDTPEHIARQRLLTNREKKTRLDVTDKDFAEILQVTEAPTSDENALVFHYDDQIENWIARNRESLS